MEDAFQKREAVEALKDCSILTYLLSCYYYNLSDEEGHINPERAI